MITLKNYKVRLRFSGSITAHKVLSILTNHKQLRQFTCRNFNWGYCREPKEHTHMKSMIAYIHAFVFFYGVLGREVAHKGKTCIYRTH